MTSAHFITARVFFKNCNDMPSKHGFKRIACFTGLKTESGIFKLRNHISFFKPIQISAVFRSCILAILFCKLRKISSFFEHLINLSYARLFGLIKLLVLTYENSELFFFKNWNKR